MTVKELKEILDACNDDAPIITHTFNSDRMLRPFQVYQEFNWTNDNKNVVVIDIDGTFNSKG
jgi:hypothetical protein